MMSQQFANQVQEMKITHKIIIILYNFIDHMTLLIYMETKLSEKK